MLDPENLGWIAATMMLATFACQTLLGMRLFAIAANIAFIAYGWADHLIPVMLLHSLLLPINFLHLARILRRKRDSAKGDSQ
jgi:CRP/FNR family transcriptional regulator, cyclic AMP receptor protein